MGMHKKKLSTAILSERMTNMRNTNAFTRIHAWFHILSIVVLDPCSVETHSSDSETGFLSLSSSIIVVVDFVFLSPAAKLYSESEARPCMYVRMDHRMRVYVESRG